MSTNDMTRKVGITIGVVATITRIGARIAGTTIGGMTTSAGIIVVMGVMGVMMITGGAIGVVGETMTVTGIIGAVGAMTTIVGIGITTGMIGTGMIGTIVGTGTMTTGTTMDVGTGWGSITGRGGIAREGGTAASACPLPTTRGLTGFMTMGGAAYAGRRMGIIGCGWITMPFSR